MTKIWCEDFTDESYTNVSIQNPRNFIGIPLAAGRRIGDRFPEGTKLVLHSNGDPFDFFMAGPMPVVSDKLKVILDLFAVAAELFPVEISKPSGEVVAPYKFYYLNILEVADCLDWNNSKFTAEKNFATNIGHLSLLDHGVPQPLFRVDRTIPSLVVASEDLAAAIVRAKCTGVVFKTPTEWRNPMNPV